jgi:thiol:disulfide interchange protein DsbD
MRSLKVILIILSILLIPFTAIAQMLPENFHFKVKDTFENSESVVANIQVDVDPGYMLYKKQIKFSSDQALFEIKWPNVTEKKDPFGPGNIKVFPGGTHIFSVQINKSEIKKAPLKIKMDYQGCSNETCFMPNFKEFTIEVKAPLIPPTPKLIKTNEAPASLTEVSAKDPKNLQQADSSQNESVAIPIQTPGGFVDFSKTLQESGTLWVLFLALLGGLLVSLTPCVYPMIPITLSIIGSRKENTTFTKGLGLSATYVGGLSLTYALLGLVAASFGAHIRSFLQGTLFQATISVIFLLLAFSMFDVFMLQAPAGLRNKLGSIKKTGILGIFIMGMVSGLMASPCVAAPLAGILAFIAATGSKFLGFFMLLFFAWGMSVPLLLIGAFSGSLNALPKAGEWMNRVKEFYGFLLLGAALYFAEPLMGAPFVEFCMAALLASFAAFLGLFSKVSEESALKQRVLKSFGVVVIVVACAFAISATTKMGYLACLSQGINKPTAPMRNQELFWHHNYDEAIAEARKTNKPVFVDFRADWCTICKELERDVFPNPKVSVLFKRMILLKVDATNPGEKINALIKKYQVVGLPTLIVLDANGKEIAPLRMVGKVSVEHLEKQLRKSL